ncbi:hypothetical protein SAMN04488505_1011052 [Chitinophaga rupis]|jgi:hypothetical protein|uniref:Uncharacterized protein n=1 Tax=Chitinophaga rupis TaxID=573321 RepID=A0A1H7KL44_9BACT|nr:MULTISPECIES: hypothetical protein [Chitinophaga]SEK87561.1 hypothetical protein SAMN04488505_1011052 [Chitinophaga rupis]
MREAAPNLWPEDILEKKITLPKALLLDQANYLSKMSNNILTVEIKTSPALMSNDGKEALTTNGLRHEFIIKVPALGNYQFPLLWIIHGSLQVYPFQLYSILEETFYEISDEEHFKSVLARVFSFEKTRNAISYIMSQV